MTKDVLGEGQLHAHEHGRPDDGVETDDLLADDVGAGPPALVKIIVLVVHEAQGGDVVKEGIHPDVNLVLGV